MPIDIGTTITQGDHEYVIKDLLKAGGFGRAFLTERTKPLPGMVVVKVPAPHVLAHPIWSQKFEREARILANIRHRNVVKIINYWELADGEKAIVQELVTGAKDLDTYVREAPEGAASALLQTLYALRAFHGKAPPAAIHRDLSPRNILVSEDGVVKVIDFGLAKEDPRATEVLTTTGEWFGTPGCIAPEQMTDAASVDHRADLFAVGRSFAAALQARNPQHADPASLPEPWRSICMRLTVHDASQRYADAPTALEDACERFAGHGVPIANFPIHIEEQKENGAATPGWAKLCQAHFLGLPDLVQSDLDLAAKLDELVFVVGFNPWAFLDHLEASSAIASHAGGFADFDDGDSLGRLYARLYPLLDPPRKLICFVRLCRTAISLHRYSVMGAIRRAYASETDPAMQIQLMLILDREDPTKVVFGMGMLPRTP